LEAVLPGGWRGFGGGGFGVGNVFSSERAVAVADFATGDGRDALAGKNDADEVERVGSGDGDLLSRRLIAGRVQGCDGFGEGKLLTSEAGDEAAAADLAAGFEAAEDVEEVAPPGGVGFAGEEVAEEDAVAGEELAGKGFEGSVGAAGAGDGGLSLRFLQPQGRR
jgi:hypothetical protein